MKKDRDKWNAKFGGRADEPLDPNPFIVEHVDRLEEGSVLDLACGDGRNALFLAESGFEVCGVDISDVGLARLRRFAAERGLDVDTHQIDLDAPDALSGLSGFDNVVISHFKPPQTFWAQAPDLLRLGGVLLIDTFSIRQHEEFGFPERFCLRPGELRDVSDKLEVVLHEEHGAPEKYLEGYLFRRV
ncbi:class I SAM-dependent methyltransferase [Persicimonas caeni]|nr:methyltransferase domain-containing protein [Persicimonas caeni]